MPKWHLRQGEQSLSFTGEKTMSQQLWKNYKGCRRFSMWNKMYNQITGKARMKSILRHKWNQELEHCWRSFFIIFAWHFVVSLCSFYLSLSTFNWFLWFIPAYHQTLYLYHYISYCRNCWNYLLIFWGVNSAPSILLCIYIHILPFFSAPEHSITMFG